MPYTEACSIGSESRPSIAFGRNGNGQTGVAEELIWTEPDVVFTPAQAKDQAYFETLASQGKLIFIGKIKPESQNTDATFAEDAELGLRDLENKAIRSTRYQGVYCACTNAEIARMNGYNGRILERTKSGFVNARTDDEGNIQGKLTSSFTVGLKTTPVAGSTWAYTVVDATFDDGHDDDMSPYEYKITWKFSDIDPVWRAEGEVTSAASGGGTLTFTLDLTKGCSDVALTGAVAGNFKLYDTAGTEITIDSVNEQSSPNQGSYDFSATTAVTSFRVELDAVQDIGGDNYVSDLINGTV